MRPEALWALEGKKVPSRFTLVYLRGWTLLMGKTRPECFLRALKFLGENFLVKLGVSNLCGKNKGSQNLPRKNKGSQNFGLF